MSEEKSSSPAVWAGIKPPKGYKLGWKVVRPDGRTYGDFQWPFTGIVKADPGDREFTHDDPCPAFPGDGLCIAQTWHGAASGGITAITGLALAYHKADVLCDSEDKLRVKACRVLGVFDLQRLLREGHGSGADLSGANLSGANLSRANLSRANLYRADLSRADLSGANLSRANLSRANLYRADLSRADLSGANLSRANLSRAYLSGADLSGAYLSGANLSGAYLSGANLSRAYLSGAYLSGADLSGALNVPKGVQS